MINFAIITVAADGLAPIGSKTSAGTTMTTAYKRVYGHFQFKEVVL